MASPALRTVTAIYDTAQAAQAAQAWLRNIGVPAERIALSRAAAPAAATPAAPAAPKRRRGLMNALVDMIFPDDEGAAAGGACILSVADVDDALYPRVVEVLSQEGKIKLEAAPADIGATAGIKGFIGACLVDTDSGLMLASQGGGEGEARLDLPLVAALNSESVKAKQTAVETLFVGQRIEDILITLDREVHLIRPLDRNRSMFVYVALDKANSNLGMARLQLKTLEAGLTL